MKGLKTVGTLLFTGALLAALSGCEKEGPAERAGKEIDKAMEQAGEQAEEAADQVGKQLEQAGENIQEAAKDDGGGN
ncbi:hypothetical protein [Marinobacterium aestuariivivens]|uniref:Lipoprotein n=1 Tax=Marinobacterium aestuariivivens TaxID=1698799 RepID=A0ABW2A3T5_9GAMM